MVAGPAVIGWMPLGVTTCPSCIMASGEGTQNATIAVPCTVSLPTGAARASRVEGVIMVYPSPCMVPANVEKVPSGMGMVLNRDALTGMLVVLSIATPVMLEFSPSFPPCGLK